MSQENVELVRQGFDAFLRGDLEEVGRESTRAWRSSSLRASSDRGSTTDGRDS
jgi:hypothetical protein